MIKKIIVSKSVFAGMLMLSFYFAGCATVDRSGGGIVHDDDVRAMDGELLDALARNDSTAFVAILPKELRAQFSREEFDNLHDSLGQTLGNPVGFEFMTSLEHPLVNISIWKVRFERRGQQDVTIRQDTLFRVISKDVNGHSEIISFNFL